MESVRQIKEWFTNRSENRLLQKFISGRDAETLIASHDDLLAACKEFVRKVECGEARSTRSYAQMKAAIKKAEE